MMRKRRLGILVIGVLALLVGAAAWNIHRHVSERGAVERRSYQKYLERMAREEAQIREDNRRGYRVEGRNKIPYPKAVTPVQSNEVYVSFCRLTEAYTNLQTEVFRQRMAQLPDAALKMVNIPFIEVRRPLGEAFSKHFLRTDRLEEFADEFDFTRFAELNVMVAKFLGDLDLQRGDMCGELYVLERNTLRKLTRYRDKFRAEGRLSLEKAAERFIAEWIRQIESERGFTRRYMWFQVSLQWGHIEEGSWTLPQLVGFVRGFAGHLTGVGYTPKWLDEFQPNEEFLRKKDVPFD